MRWGPAIRRCAGVAAALALTVAGGGALAARPATFAHGAVVAVTLPLTVPAGTRLRFHLREPLSSDRTKSGEPFTFVLLDPLVVNETIVAAAGAAGSGTVVLAGHNGTSGHEGDLTLQIETLATVTGGTIVFDFQQLKINGRNEKVVSGVLGFVPFAGLGARFIRGSEIRLDPATPIETVLERPATITIARPQSTIAPPPAPAPTPS